MDRVVIVSGMVSNAGGQRDKSGKIMESSLIRLEYSPRTFVDGLGGTLSDSIQSATIPVKLFKVSFQTVSVVTLGT